MHKLAMRVGWAHALVLASCLCYAEALCVSLPLHHARLPLPGCRLSALPLRSQLRLRAPAAQMLADAAGEKQAAASNGDGAFAGLAEQIGRALGEDEHGGAGAAAAGARAGGERGEADASANAQDSGWMAKWSDVATGIVLIVGDGNLSFSLALVRAFPKMRLIATTFDSEQFVRDKYGAGDVIAELKEKGAEVYHGVDATALDSTLLPRLASLVAPDCVVFNFPHHPGKGRIQRNRDLVRDFLLNATAIISPTGHIRVSLAAGQGGTAVDKPRLWGDTWQVTAQGTVAGLLLSQVYPFEPPPGYYCRGYKSQDKGFHLTGALQHIFVPQERGIKGLYPPEWAHDISFWITDDFEDVLFERLAKYLL